ncbi:sugar transferase [Staphylococcus simulans]|nr:sugar transferase [Staphylococcus simulans]UXR44425.1 sugar transferase [Staphylococcus simulans]
MVIKMLKRAIDLAIGSSVFLVSAPILVGASVAIAKSMGRPVLFKQQRPGLNGEPFYIYKFRTMTDARDDQGELLPDEQRMTKVGSFIRKTSIDELPQLINVIKGDLSLVGPRPLLMEYLPLYSDEQKKRHLVKPGITGWAQVNGRNAISWEAKFKLDVWYVENQSFKLDMYILYKTFINVLNRKDVSAKDHVTMEKFRGSPQ